MLFMYMCTHMEQIEYLLSVKSYKERITDFTCRMVRSQASLVPYIACIL